MSSNRPDEYRRYEYIYEMERLYLEHPYSDVEMAERLGTDRTNVWRIRKIMTEQMLIPIEPYLEKQGKYYIHPDYSIRHIPFNREQMAALYLAGRRLQQQTRTSQKHVVNALQKLASALRKPLAQNLVRAAEAVLEQEQDARREQIFAVLVHCWLDRIPVRITHRVLHGQPRTYLVYPYQIEPSVWGDGNYLIGHSDFHGNLATFKIERIEKVVEATGQYEIPDDFDVHELLNYAWGIWHADTVQTPVRLRFSRYVAPRVLESIWHPQQTILQNDDGSLIWESPIAEWREMVPWVRGWGADVEVLEPPELRIELGKIATRLARLYEVTTMCQKFPHHIPYAKTNRKNKDEIHLLLYHLIDVGQVALIMWQEILTGSIRKRLAAILGLSVEESGRFLAFLAALHDLGKAGPAYQSKYAPDWLKKDLHKAGLVMGKPAQGKAYDSGTPHGTVTTWSLNTLLPEMAGIERRFAKKIATALGGHHGVWPQPGAANYISDSDHPEWEKVRRDLVWELVAVFDPPSGVSAITSTTDLNTFLTILSGLTSVADWIGSRNDECFEYVQQPMSSRRYAQRSAAKAREGLSDLGWMGWEPRGETRTFAKVFDYLGFTSARDVQQQVIEETENLEQPILLIMEAPTGIGKTETALYVADRWLQQHEGRGLYVAMPTQATSNQMYERTGEFLHQRYPDMAINYHLVHGQAAWMDELKNQVELQGVGDDVKAHISAESWFTPRKRTLLAPFGVGTVDQTLMSILQTKHFFVRLFGLSHKIVIFDEVHAYDTYMNTLFQRLLTWLNALGTSVIILSATLPAKTRHELVEAYTGQALPITQSTYPALTIANTHRQQTIPLPNPDSYTLQLDWNIDRDPAAIVEFLKEELAGGGCAAVICNTVRRAQGVYQALTEAQMGGEIDVSKDDLILFHSRYPPIWRKGIEEKVRTKFEKGGERPHRAVVVATQVIEQSLDIDFDLMISDLAPIDLILQRAGRLHRHADNERYGLPRRLVILRPETGEDGIPQFREDGFYGEYILLRSYLALRQRGQITVPQDMTELLELVYDKTTSLGIPSEAWQVALDQASGDLENKDRKTEAKAARPIIHDPTSSRMLKQTIEDLDEDDPTTHATFRAQTRDIDFSITVVCLHKAGELVGVFDKDNNLISFSIEDDLQPGFTKILLQNAISIQQKGIGKHFVEQPVPPSWQENATLRYCRYVTFDDGICNDIPGYTLFLNQDLGLKIEKKEDT